jgi:hypothetical protein
LAVPQLFAARGVEGHNPAVRRCDEYFAVGKAYAAIDGVKQYVVRVVWRLPVAPNCYRLVPPVAEYLLSVYS